VRQGLRHINDMPAHRGGITTTAGP